MQKRTRRILFALGAVAWVLGSASSPFAGDEDEARGDDAKEKDEDRWFAVVGGDVHTGTGALLRGATVLSKNGEIVEIGHDLWLPEETEVLDAHGYSVYPGLVALGASSTISRGMFSAEEPSAVDDLDHLGENRGISSTHVEGPDEDEVGEPEDTLEAQEAGAGVRSKLEDGFDPFSPYLVLALATGITTAEQSGAAVKLRRGEIDGVVMNERNLVSLSWSVRNPSGIRSLREKFRRAAEYLAARREWEELDDEDVKEPSRKGVDSGALRILEGSALARFKADAREDLLGIARFAQQYGFRPVVEGAREGWTVADELGRAGAYAIVTPRDRRPKDESLVRPGGSSIENAAILHRAGVQVAIRPQTASFETIGITGRDLLHLPTEAAFAVRGGLPEQAALEGLTIVPARILGVAHRVGTLEVGKDCDLIVTDGDLLHYQTFVQWAVVAGKVVYDKQEELYFAHIRPRPPREASGAGEGPESEPDPAPAEAPAEGGGIDQEDG